MTNTMTNLTVRRSISTDRADLVRLAALDSGSPPRGPALIAEADSRMLAALPLGSGRAIADPFEPTAEITALLDLRRAQLDRATNASHGRASRLRGLLRGRLSHA